MGVITTAQYTITKVNDGLKGEDAIIGVLDNDSHVIPTDFNGENGNYAGANSTIIIFKGATNDTSNWKITATASTGITGSLSGFKYTITNIDKATDNGSINFLAEKSGSADIRKSFTVTKSKNGESGQNAVTYSLFSETSYVQRDALTGLTTPESLVISGKSKAGAGEILNFSGYFIVYEQSKQSLTVDEYQQLVVAGQIKIDDEYVLSESPYPYVKRYESFALELFLDYRIKSDTTGLKFEWYKDAEKKIILDMQTIPVVSDGLTSHVHIAYATNETGTENFSTLNPVGKTYMGQYTDFHEVDSENPSDYKWNKVKGDGGEDATNYWLSGYPSVIKRNGLNVYTPLNFSAIIISQKGLGLPANYLGRFIIQETTDNTTWVTKYTSSVNESTKNFTPSVGIKAVKIKVYLLGGVTNLIDEQIIPVVEDGSDPVVAILSTPLGTVIKNSTGNLTLEANLYKGGKIVTPTAYKWYELDTSIIGGWRQLTSGSPDGTTGHTTKTLTVTPTSITSVSTYKVEATYNAIVYSDMVTLTDLSDPISVIIIGSGIYKNGQGTNSYIARLYRNGKEIDEFGTIYLYKWNLLNKDGTLNSSFTATGKEITIPAIAFDDTAQLKCDVDDKK